MKCLQGFLMSLVVLGFASNSRADVIELAPGSSIQVGSNVVRCSGNTIGGPQLQGGNYRSEENGSQVTIFQEQNVIRLIDGGQTETYRCDTFGFCLESNDRYQLHIVTQRRFKIVYPSSGRVIYFSRVEI